MTKKYQLYVGLLQDIPENVEFSFYDSAKRRLFLLSTKKPSGKFAPVPRDLWGELTADESRWLLESCREVNRRWMKEHEKEAAQSANVLLDLFEEELKKEAQNAHEGENGKDQSDSGDGDVSD